MKFNKYSSIENSYRLKEVYRIQENFPGEEFVAMEKVHGSNFQLVTDGTQIRYGKRRGLLSEDDNFYKYKTMDLEALEVKVKEIYNLVKRGRPEVSQMSIHGELCGGSYPHPDVEKVKGIKGVQKEVFYHPEIKFLVFDIMINNEYISTYETIKFCTEVGLDHLPILKSGTLEECLQYPNDFESKVPEMFGLPKIEGNIIEGTVVKPMRSLRLPCGSRPILKNKNARFSEKAKKKKDVSPLPDHIMQWMTESNEYITENRLRNVISKEGTFQKNEFGRIIQLMNQDTIEDFLKDNPTFNELEKSERKQVTRFMNGKIAELIRPNFANIIDGEF